MIDYKIGYGETEVSSRINIYITDDLKEILDEKLEDYLDYLKIGDNFFKFKEKEIFFFYNEKDNKIEYINNVFNYLNNIKDDKLNKEYENLLLIGEDYPCYDTFKKKYIQKYFYLADKLFSFFDNDSGLYIVDISNENKIVRKIELNWDIKKYFLKDILYNETKDKEENLYICLGKKGEQIEIEGEIIHGIIEKKKE